MKTKITETIDGIKIIRAIGEAQIDPESTKPIAGEKLIASDEYKAFVAKQNEIAPYIITARTASNNAKKMYVMEYSSTSASDKAKYAAEKTRYANEAAAANAVIEAKRGELEQIVVALNEKRRSLINENAVYFMPKPGEKNIEDSEAEIIRAKMTEAIQKEKLLADDLSLVDDYRNVTVWLKSGGQWSSREILTLGDKPAASEKLESDITEAERTEIANQIEKDRIKKLSVSEKTAEKTASLAILLSQAAQKKTELEIMGATASQATKDAKAWYDAEVAKVEKIYA